MRQPGWRRVCAALAIAAIAGTSAVAAERFPDKPVRLMVGFTPGGTADTLARLLSRGLTESLGQPVVVENRPGAGSNIAAEQVTRAAADGHTLLVMAVTSAINQSLYPKLRFDIQRDFAPVALITRVPNVLVVKTDSPIDSVQTLVRTARERPGALTFASSGNGTSNHIAGELLKMLAGIDLLHVPFKGSAQGLTALMAGQVDVMFDNAALPYVQAGRMRPLAVTTAQRSSFLPDVPTMMAAGYPKFEASSWFGVLAPAGTPVPVLERLNAAVNAVLAQRATREALAQLGAVPEQQGRAEFGRFIDSEVQRWAEVVRVSGARVE